MTLLEIAERTKIHQPLLEELERDNVAHWPSGIFRRAFIRAYAEAIGLRPDDVVREFLSIYPDAIEVVSIGAALASVASTKRRPPTRLSYVAGAAWESVLGGLRTLFGQEHKNDPIAATDRAHATAEVDLLAAGHLCTKLAQADADSDVSLLLREAARILDAVGLIVWLWDPRAAELKPALTEGYSAGVLAQLPAVRRDADNATAAAFRSARTCAVAAGDTDTAALVVPMMSPEGCVGVLAVELPSGGEQAVPVRAVVTMFAAHLARLTTNPSARAGVVEMGERRPFEFSEPHHDQIGSRVHTQIVHAAHG